MPHTGDHDVVLLRDRTRVEGCGLRDEIGEDSVGIAGRDRDDPLAIVGHDVQAKTKTRPARDLANGFVKWVAFDLGEAHPRVLQKAHAVGRRDHGLTAASDRDRLAATRVARVLMWLDYAGRHDQIRILDELLRETGDAVRRDRPEVGPHRGIAPVRVDDANAVDDRPELLALFGGRRLPVESDRDDDGDALVRDSARVQLVEEWRDEDRIG